MKYCSTFHRQVFAFLFATLVWSFCNCTCEETQEECFFNKPDRTKMPAADEYGVYLTRKSECAMLRREAATYTIPLTGDPTVGVIKLPHTHEIPTNQPYAAQEATVYSVACPEGYLSYFKLLSFDLDPDTCSDYLKVRMSSGEVITMCGCHANATSTPIVGDIDQLFFRSDNNNLNGRSGFTAVMQCFRPQDENMEGCSTGSDEILNRWIKRRRRRRNADAPSSISAPNHLPAGDSKAALATLGTASFEVLARGSNRQTEDLEYNTETGAYFSNDDIETAICYMRSCSAVARAAARAVLNYTNSHQPGRIDRIYRSKFTAPTSTTPTSATNETASPTPPPHPVDERCVDTSMLPMCSEIGYPKAYFPNFREQKDPAQAREELIDFMPLVRLACSNAIAHLLCSVYAPFCSDDDPDHLVRPYPCAEMCHRVRSSCLATVESYGISWPAQLNCEDTDIYKPENSTDVLVYCPPENVTLPSNLLPLTTTTDTSRATVASTTPSTTPSPETTPTNTSTTVRGMPTSDATPAPETTPTNTSTTVRGTPTSDATPAASQTPNTPQIRTITPPHNNQPRCESISAIPACTHIGYQHAYFPSFRHQTALGANIELGNLQPLIDSNCSSNLLHLLCSVNAPLCYTGSDNQPQRVQPCVELCQHVRRSCEPVLLSNGLRWPSHLDCGNSDIYVPNNPAAYCPANFNASTEQDTAITPTTETTPSTTPTAPTPTITQPVPDPPSEREAEYTCSAMTNIPVCSPLQQVGWGNVSFPNFRGHETQQEAREELKDFRTLVQIQCSNALVHFLCSVYAPFCDNDYPQLRLRPCKELCLHVRENCEDNLLAFGYRWPEHFDCDNPELYPAKTSGVINFCPSDIEGLLFPPLPSDWAN